MEIAALGEGHYDAELAVGHPVLLVLDDVGVLELREKRAFLLRVADLQPRPLVQRNVVNLEALQNLYPTAREK